MPEIAWLEKYFFVPPAALALAIYLFGGLPWLVYGFCLPTMTLAHATFGINTVNHLFGSRRFETMDDSRNNAFTAFFAAGEGWHNNHHRYQRAARNGFYWWEFDLTWYTIRAMSLLVWCGTSGGAGPDLRRSAGGQSAARPPGGHAACSMPARWRWSWRKSPTERWPSRCASPSSRPSSAPSCRRAGVRPRAPRGALLDGGPLIVNNQTRQEWTSIEIWVDSYYRATAPSLAAGGRLTAPLNAFITGFGQRFDFRRAQIEDLRLTARLPDGKPFEIKKAFEEGGLKGALGGVGGKR